MRSLKECLLNEVRLTIHNTKVANHKALNDVEAGDIVYWGYYSGNQFHVKSDIVLLKHANGSFNFLDGAVNLFDDDIEVFYGDVKSKSMVFKYIFSDFVYITSTDENEFKRLVKKYAK